MNKLTLLDVICMTYIVSRDCNEKMILAKKWAHKKKIYNFGQISLRLRLYYLLMG